ncbi:DMT family transporter [Rummeliibacillus sp. JY-2-4R]
MENMSKKKTVLSIAAVILIWSLCWPIYKVGLNYTPPLLFSGMRSFLGGLLLALFLLPQWRKIQWNKCWYIYIIVGLFNTVIFQGLQTVGLQFLPSGLYSVIVYLQPVLVVLLAWLWLKESLTRTKIIGMLLGFLGVVVVSIESFTGNISLLGVILALITSIGWALGVIYVRKTAALVHGLWLVALQNLIGGGFLTVSGLITEDFSSIEWNIPYISCLIYGCIFGVTCATALYFKLMGSGDASKVGAATFLVPLLAVAIGTIVLGEPFTWSLVIGLLLILISIYTMNRA